MPTRNIAGQDVEVDENGHLKNMDKWSREIAAALAAEEGIPALNDRHWAVIDFVRKDTRENNASPTVRRISKVSGIGTKELYDLFPGGPGKKASKIAGVPRPVGCV